MKSLSSNCFVRKTVQLFVGALIVVSTIPFNQKSYAAPEVVNLPKRFGVTQRGGMVLAGNTVQTCVTTSGYVSCSNARNALNSGLNDKFNMVYVDIDGDASTFNSSRASMSIPAGATVTFAGLFWGGNVAKGVLGQPAPNTSISNTVYLASPTSGYVNVIGRLIGTDNTTGLSRTYGAFADVTALVKSGGNGDYRVANIQTGTGIRDDNGASGGLFAGWSLIVIYSHPHFPLRNMNIWDGFFRVAEYTTGNISVNNFLTPLTGNFQTTIGTFVFEGDYGLLGDSLQLNGSTISNSANPSNNIFNGTTTQFASSMSRFPSYANSLGVDVDVFDASGLIPNGATSTSIVLPTRADNYFPTMVSMAVDVFEPKLEILKRAEDLNGGYVNPGDTVRYTIQLTNTGVDTATKVVIDDQIPPGMTYVPSTLRVNIDPGGNTGTKTDAIGDDQAEFNAGANAVRYRLGVGANGTQGGQLQVGQTATVEFCVRVNDDVRDGTLITNTGISSYSGSVISSTYTITDSSSVTIRVIAPDLSVVKTDGGKTAKPGETVVYFITAKNESPYTTVTGAVLTETLPPHTTFAGPSSWQRVGTSDQYVRELGSMAPGASAVVTFGVRVNNPVPTGVTELDNLVIIGDDGSHGPDQNEDNNKSRDKTPLKYADLSVLKSNGTISVTVGEWTTYTIVITNAGPSEARGVRVIDPTPHGGLLASWTCSASAGSSCDTLSGSGDISTTVNITASSRVTFTYSMLVGQCDGLLVNTVRVISPDDPNESDNTSTDIDTDGDGVNFWLRIASSPMYVGDTMIYTLTVTNYGPDGSAPVTITNALQGSAVYSSHVASRGTYASGTWSVGSLGVGETATIVFTTFIGEHSTLGSQIIITATLDSPALGNAPLRVVISDTIRAKPIPTALPIYQLFLPSISNSGSIE